VSKASNWLRATVDNKPWWAIILAAFLASLGSEVVKNVPGFVSFARSYFPVEATVFVIVKNNGAGPPRDGPKISIMDTRAQNFLPIVGSNDTSVMMKSGVASVKVRVMPGPGYLIVLSYTDGGKTLRYSDLVEIRGDLQYPITFDQKTWPPSDVVFESAPSLPAASAIASSADLPGWMKFAYGEVGQREKPGPEHNPRILEYFRATQIANPPQDDETPWSSAFIHWVLRQANISGTRSLSDRSWMTWGAASDLKPGCIAVFWRVSPESGLGHAGFLVSVLEDNSLAILGGNQNDEVRISSLSRSRLLGCRWPT
jgi:uncharacterized protein (TIGR02594 family)